MSREQESGRLLAPPLDGGAETLVDMFERTARGWPDRPAVIDDEHTLSYAELSARSGEVGRALTDRGVQRGDRVAIYLNRCSDVFVAILGVLKAGAAYVPVDTRYPDHRRDQMIRGSEAALVITGPGWTPRVCALGVDALGVDVLECLAGPPVVAAGTAPPITPVDLACVLFTSGSSGTPKAVMLEHRNLLYLAENEALAALEPGDRVGQVSSVSFDAFHVETWCAFAHGAGVAVLPAMPDLIARDLRRELRRRRITAMLAPTMAVNHVVHEDRDAFDSIRILYTGGDVLQPLARREVMSGAFSGEFRNLYGPTETTTACTGYLITGTGEGGESVPIGRELAGATVHLLDAELCEVPPGAVGEIHIGGRGVGRGYLGRPATTAERFLPDPRGGEGARMYATGDLARRDEAGLLRFLGRADQQVKIRGYRVEPREVELAMLAHPALRDAAVIVAGEAHDRLLVALVVLHQRISPRELREFAAERLPDYLVPSSFVPVPEIPGNDHGKRDLDVLRRLAAEELRRQHDRIEPRDEIERHLASVWEQLLAVDRVGATDDFFALGGNSLLGFRMQRRILRDLGVTLDVKEILETGRLSGLADLVRARRGVPAPAMDTGELVIS